LKICSVVCTTFAPPLVRIRQVHDSSFSLKSTVLNEVPRGFSQYLQANHPGWYLKIRHAISHLAQLMGPYERNIIKVVKVGSVNGICFLFLNGWFKPSNLRRLGCNIQQIVPENHPSFVPTTRLMQMLQWL